MKTYLRVKQNHYVEADQVTEAEVVAAFESRRPVSEEEHNTMAVQCAPRLRQTDAAFDALIGALNSLEWPTHVDIKAEVFVDRERFTATVVLGDMRVRAVLTPVEALMHKNPTSAMLDHEADPAGVVHSPIHHIHPFTYSPHSPHSPIHPFTHSPQ